MAKLEAYARVRVHEGRLRDFKRTADALIDAVQRSGETLLRYEWFVGEPQHQALMAIVAPDENAMAAHHRRFQSHYAGLLDVCDITAEILARPSSEVLASLDLVHPRPYVFACGLKSMSDPLDENYRGTWSEARPIDMLTQFEIKAGRMDDFKTLARQLVAIVGKDDPGTFRYDWYCDDAASRCVVRDIYADPASIFAHMKNCKTVHDELLSHTTLHVNHFMGALPPEVKAVVSKYDGFLLERYRGPPV